MRTTDTTEELSELDALRRDAARYRWLRERAWYVEAAARHVMGWERPRRHWSDDPPGPDWDEVEDALDVLMCEAPDGNATDYL